MDVLSIKVKKDMKRRKENINVYNIIHYKQTCGKHFSFSDSSNSNKVNNKFKGEMTIKWVASPFLVK